MNSWSHVWPPGGGKVGDWKLNTQKDQALQQIPIPFIAFLLLFPNDIMACAILKVSYFHSLLIRASLMVVSKISS